MKLFREDADLFFELMWSLQLYVSQQLNIFPKVTTIEDYRKLPQKQKIKVREALYDKARLIDQYVEVNPQKLSAAHLAIVESWKQFIRGDFFIERYLKKYAVFIQDQKVYGVLALNDSFEEMLPHDPLPMYVSATLLPFRDKIIYDGLIGSYSIYLGGGISSELKEIYLTAKQNGTILERLDIQRQFTEQRKQSLKNWLPEVDKILADAKRLQAKAGDPAQYGPIFALTKASLELNKAVVTNPDDLDALRTALKIVQKAVKRVERTLFRAER